MKVTFIAAVALAALLSFATAGSAHHGAAGYDSNKLTTLQGTVTDFRFQNPHAQILLDVKDSSGKVQNWILEAVGIATLSRSGWTKSIIKPGDTITVTGNAAKNGSPAMRLTKVVLANGKELGLERGEDYLQ
jgi:basic membrane lipoprotein Med (substrate-binding protein (PBP1-ABC) superfamily)